MVSFLNPTLVLRRTRLVWDLDPVLDCFGLAPTFGSGLRLRLRSCPCPRLRLELGPSLADLGLISGLNSGLMTLSLMVLVLVLLILALGPNPSLLLLDLGFVFILRPGLVFGRDLRPGLSSPDLYLGSGSRPRPILEPPGSSLDSRLVLVLVLVLMPSLLALNSVLRRSS